MLVRPSISEVYQLEVAEAERAAVSCALVDASKAFATNLNKKHFYDPVCGEVWTAAERVHAQGRDVDIFAVVEELNKAGKNDAVGGYTGVSDFVTAFHRIDLLDRYGEVIRGAWAARELTKLASQVAPALMAGQTVAEVSDKLRGALDQLESSPEKEASSLLSEVREEQKRIKDDLARIARGEPPETGLPSGLGIEQISPVGIPKDRVTLVFGETGTFKTAVKQWICDTIAASGKYVLDFTLEDSKELTAQRFLSRHTGIPYGRIASRVLSKAEERKLEALLPLAEVVAERTIVVGNVPPTIEEAVRKSREWARKVPLAAVCLDYIQLLDSKPYENEARQIKAVMSEIQRASFRDKIAWVVVSQMNRDFSRRESRRPELTDLYGSSAIAQMTKLAIGVYRPSMYCDAPDQDSPWHKWYVNNPRGPELWDGAIELWVRKCVNGRANTFVPLIVDPETGSFTVLSPEDLK